LHLNWQLYGWCALPLVGALLRFHAPPSGRRDARWAGMALAAWTFALLAGGLSWLGGVVSGKLFLDWHGWARPLLPAAMGALWLVLAGATKRNWRCWSVRERWTRALLLAGLAAVPGLLFWASGRDVYPAVNPHSGGATGASLLASTLGVVGIFAVLPALTGTPRRAGATSPLVFGAAWLAGWAVYGVIDHGNASHHAGAQVAGLAVLMVWIPLLPAWLGGFAWSGGARPWLRAATVW